MPSAENYLNPAVIQSVARLDLRAKFIIEGFLSGLHASPFHGFSVEFSEHRRYTQGDDPADIDWLVYAKTDRYYIKKYQAETNLSGYLLIDQSASMGYTYRQQLTKFDYSICLAAAISYLMIHQNDPVGLVTFDTQLRTSLPPRSRRTQLGTILATLARMKPQGQTDLAAAVTQFTRTVRHRSLVMIFSDLLSDAEPFRKSLHQLRHAGHDIIVFHVLDEAEVTFPFEGMVDLEDPETSQRMQLDGRGMRPDYLAALAELRDRLKADCNRIGADYVPLDTSLPFDRALIEYLSQRRAHG